MALPLALHLERSGHGVTLVPRRAEQAIEIAARRENLDYLPGLRLPAGMAVSSDLAGALAAANVVLLACPAQALRVTAERVRAALTATPPCLVVSLAKGMELGTHLRPSEVIAAVLPEVAIGALSGPTNALGVARGDPSAMVLAATAGGCACLRAKGNARFYARFRNVLRKRGFLCTSDPLTSDLIPRSNLPDSF